MRHRGITASVLLLLLAPACASRWRALAPTRAPGAEAYPDAHAVVLYREADVWYASPRHEAGPPRAFLRARGAVRILTTRGLKHARVVAQYSSLKRIVDFGARVVSPEGVAREVPDQEIRSYSSGDKASSLVDTMVLIARPSDVKPGDILQYRYTIEYHDAVTLAGRLLQHRSLPVRRATLAVRLEPGVRHRVTYYRNGVAAELAARRVARRDGYAWEERALTDLPAFEREPYAPGFGALAAQVHLALLRYPARRGTPPFVGFTNWDRFAAWIRRPYGAPLPVAPPVRALARRLFRGTQGRPLEKVRRAFRFAQGRIRYHAISLGMGGWKPRPARRILANGYGDCKDKATLLIALLRTAKIPAHPVLLGTHGRTLPAPAVPSLGNYNHVIAAIDLPGGRRLYVDPTSSVTALENLPGADQGRPALVITDRGHERVTLPLSSPEENRIDLRFDLRLSETGGVSGRVEGTYRGDSAREVRSALLFQPEKERRRALRRLVGAWEEAPDLDTEHLRDYDRPLTIRGPFIARHVSSRAGPLLLFHPHRVFPATVPDLPSGPRRSPLVLDAPRFWQVRATIRPPRGYDVGEIPLPQRLRGRFGRFEIRYARNGARAVSLQLVYRRTVRDAPPAVFARVRAFFARILAALRQVLPFRRR